MHGHLTKPPRFNAPRVGAPSSPRPRDDVVFERSCEQPRMRLLWVEVHTRRMRVSAGVEMTLHLQERVVLYRPSPERNMFVGAQVAARVDFRVVGVATCGRGVWSGSIETATL